jgi:hypothetical protein
MANLNTVYIQIMTTAAGQEIQISFEKGNNRNIYKKNNQNHKYQ